MRDECCTENEKEEKSELCELVFDELRSLFWTILDLENKESQEKVTVSLFQKLGKFTDLTKLAEALLAARAKIKLAAVVADVEEDKQEEDIVAKRSSILDDMLEVIDSDVKQGVGASSKASDTFVTV